MRDAHTDSIGDALTYTCNTMWNDEAEMMTDFYEEEGLTLHATYKSQGALETSMLIDTDYGVMYCYYVDSKQRWGAKY